MIAFDDAIAMIARSVFPLGQERVPIEKAAGRVLAADLLARNDAPRHAVSAMDGYAVADATTRPGLPCRVIGESRAGAGFAGRVGAGEVVRIFTGAPLPQGADRCIVQEAAVRDGDMVIFREGYGPGWHVRAAGSDFTAGTRLLAAGTRLDAKAMVVAAAADQAELDVATRPRIAIIGTGDELAPPGQAHARPDAIPESVTFGVAAFVAAQGGIVTSRQTGADALTDLQALAQEALPHADLVVVTGGASVGERDFAKPMFAGHGLDLLFAKVGMKPGKPVWLGRAQRCWVLGLPGNPTSAMVTARLILGPVLARLQGQSEADGLMWRRLPLAAPLPETGDRETFARAIWGDDGLHPLANQDSGAQSTLAMADWLIRCPAGQAPLPAGSMVDALLF